MGQSIWLITISFTAHGKSHFLLILGCFSGIHVLFDKVFQCLARTCHMCSFISTCTHVYTHIYICIYTQTSIYVPSYVYKIHIYLCVSICIKFISSWVFIQQSNKTSSQCLQQTRKGNTVKIRLFSKDTANSNQHIKILKLRAHCKMWIDVTLSNKMTCGLGRLVLIGRGQSVHLNLDFLWDFFHHCVPDSDYVLVQSN